MIRNTIGWKSLALIFIFSISLKAQTSNQRQVSTVFTVLTKSVESKNATVGQELTLRTTNDVVVSGEVIIPKESKLVGHVTAVSSKGRDAAQTALAIVIDKAVRSDGVVIPVQAIIAAVAAPRENSLSSDPTYGIMHSNEPKMVGARPSTAAGTGELPASSKASSTAAVATANIKGGMDAPLLLNENSQGAVGYEGLSLSWILITPPPTTVFVSKSKSLKLETGTQMLLRMVPPRLAR